MAAVCLRSSGRHRQRQRPHSTPWPTVSRVGPPHPVWSRASSASLRMAIGSSVNGWARGRPHQLVGGFAHLADASRQAVGDMVRDALDDGGRGLTPSAHTVCYGLGSGDSHRRTDNLPRDFAGNGAPGVFRSTRRPRMPTHLCLDFGTAYCKAASCATGEPPVPLAIGRAVRQGRGDPHMIRTALFISRSGRLFFGEAAVDTAASADREPFDTIKEALIEAEDDRDFDKPIPAEHSPTSPPITKRQAITLFLAFFTRAASRATHTPDGTTRSVAMPVFEKHKAKWVSEMLQGSLIHAHVLAEHFADDLFESIDLRAAIRLLEELRNRPTSLRSPTPQTVVEPVAAVAAQLLHYTPSGHALPVILMVVDVGAGTTDIAMFAAGQADGVVTVRHVKDSKRSEPVAGKAIDQALVDHIVDKGDGKLGLEVDLLREGRGQPIKEDLFRDRRVSRYGGSTSVQDFLESAQARTIIKEMKAAFDGVLSDIDRSFFQRQVAVRFSGGGAFLPFLDDFVRPERLLPGPPNEKLTRVRMATSNREPQWKTEPRFRNLYGKVGAKFHRMAVALGGAYYGAEGRSWLELEEDIPWLGK